MKYSEFQRWLLAQGVMIDKKGGKGSHRKARYQDKATVFPYHGSKEIGENLGKKIIQDLGLGDKN